MLREHARTIWDAAVEAAQPQELVRRSLADPTLPLKEALKQAKRIIVVGAGKAGASMACAVESTLADAIDRIEGLVNVPADPPFQAQKIILHEARPAGSNHPTKEGVEGAEKILRLLSESGPEDVALCLISGGGSALLPAPVQGITLEDKQSVTQLLHRCGATINEMNAVRKHLSRVKGGQMAQAFTGKALFSLIISDVIGDPLDVIASGPTAADPSTFDTAYSVLEKYDLLPQVTKAIGSYLEAGRRGEKPETLKELPDSVQNYVIGNNVRSLQAAQKEAESLGYTVINLGSWIEGETKEVAKALSGIFRSTLHDQIPAGSPVCLLSGGETTVTLSSENGKGGRNQEFVLAAALHLNAEMASDNWIVLSGGTDGEDGPTDAAGAIANGSTLSRADDLGLSAADSLARHDAYPFFEALGDLVQTGLTWTNVMDVRVMLACQAE